MGSSVPSAATVQAIFDQLGPPGTPFTTPEIAAEFDCSDRTIYNRLDALVDEGTIETKKVGAKGRVWWKPVDGDIRQNGGAVDHRVPVSLRDGQSPSFCSDGEMAERIREFEWAETLIGPVTEWPQELRVAVDMMLGADEAIGVYWGEDLILLYNDAAREQIGKKHPDALGRPARKVFPEAWETLGPMHEQVMAGEGAVRVEEQYLPIERGDELEDIWWDTSYNPIPLADGSVGGVFNVAVDITDRVQAEAELRERTQESEERYQTVLNSMDEGFFLADVVFDSDGEPLDIFYRDSNPAAIEMIGEEFEGRWLTEIDMRNEDYLYEVFGRVASTGKGERQELYAEPDGIWYDFYVFKPEGAGPRRVAVVFEDITERKEAERALQHRADLDAFRVDLNDAIRTLSDPEEIQQEAARVLGERLGVDRAHYGEVLEDGTTNRIHADYCREGVESVVGEHDFTDYGDYIADTLLAGETLVLDDLSSLPDLSDEERAAHRRYDIDAYVSVPLVKDGQLTAYCGVTQDTPRDWTDTEVAMVEETAERTWAAVERAQAEQELRESEARFSKVLEQLPIGVGVLDADGNFEMQYDLLEVLIGGRMPSIDPEQRDHWTAWDDDGNPLPPTQWPGARALRGEEVTPGVEFRFERGETTRWINVATVPFETDEEPNGALVVFQDITERKGTEEALRETKELLADELASMHRLHDLRATLANETDLHAAFGEIIEAANDVLDTDRGCIQLVSDDGERLEMAEYRGYDEQDPFVQHFLHEGSKPACDAARQNRERLVIEDVESFPGLQGTTDREVALEDDIRATQSTPMISRDGELVGVLSNQFPEPHRPSDRELQLIDLVAWTAAEFFERHRAHEELRESEARLAAELEGIKRLQEISTQSIQDGNGDDLYDAVLDTAVEMLDADFGSLQRMEPGTDVLELITHRGLNEEAESAWAQVSSEHATACGKALQTEEHVVVSDVETSDFIAGTDDLETFRQAGIQAVLTTPLVSRSGDVVGMLSTHWAEPHEPSERDLHLLDVLARQVADLLQQRAAYEALSESEASLQRLNTATRKLIDTETATIADRVAPLVRDVLDVEYAALWQYDDQRGDLDEYAVDVAPDLDGNVVTFPTEITDRVWEAFIGTDVAVTNDLDVPPAMPSPLRSHAFVPLGRHGVVCLGSTSADAFGEQTVDLVKTVASTVETTWDRADSEDALARQNEELTRLDRLNTLIRAIDQALVGADTREAVDDAVCEQLANSDLYESAWLATYDSETDTLRPQAWAGIDSGYLEDRTVTVGDASSDDPLVAAHRTREMQVVSDIATDARASGWREDALERGRRSCITIPLVYEESTYGILTVYGRTPQPDDRETDVLSELGETIAHAIHALEATITRRTDSVVELTLRTREASTPLARLGRKANCEITVEGLIPSGTDDALTVFFTATDVSPEALAATSAEVLAIEDLDCLDERDDRSLYRAHLTDPHLGSLLVTREAVVRSLSVEDGTVTIVADLPETEAVSEFLDELREQLPDLELLARTTRTRPLQTQYSLRMTLEDRLTARHLEVLQMAYESGFFESPRVQTGKDLSEALDISQSTFTYHLRESQRRLCEMVFEPV